MPLEGCMLLATLYNANIRVVGFGGPADLRATSGPLPPGPGPGLWALASEPLPPRPPCPGLRALASGPLPPGPGPRAITGPSPPGPRLRALAALAPGPWPPGPGLAWHWPLGVG